MNQNLTMLDQTKQMLLVGICFTIKFPKPKSGLIIPYSILNQTCQLRSFNHWINRTPGDNRSEKRETFLPITPFQISQHDQIIIFPNLSLRKEQAIGKHPNIFIEQYTKNSNQLFCLTNCSLDLFKRLKNFLILLFQVKNSY